MPETIEKSFFNSPESVERSEAIERRPEVAEFETNPDEVHESDLGSVAEGLARADVSTALQRPGEQLSLPHAEIAKVSLRLADFRLWEQELQLRNTEDFARREAEMAESSLDSNYELTGSNQ